MNSWRSSFQRAVLCLSAFVVAAAAACSAGQGAANNAAVGDAGQDSALTGAVAPDDASPFAPDTSMPQVAEDPDSSLASSDDAPAPIDLAPAPTLAAIAPAQAVVGTAGPTIDCTGTGFVSRSVVQVNGVPLVTSFVSSTELRATIPDSDMSSLGMLDVTIGTAPPGGGGSADLSFQVVNPTPTVTALNPTSTVLGSTDTSLTVTGSSFVTGAAISFNGAALATSVTGPTTATATVPASALATPGLYPVTVTNPAPGGGASSSIAFIVSNPSVTVTTVTPSTLVIDGLATSIALVGSGFVAASAVSFNGTPITTTYTSSTQLTATVPAKALLNAGAFPVAVTNPAPGGGVSAPVTVNVVYPAVSATSISPASVTLGAPPPTVTLTGSGFISGVTTLAFDGTTALTTVADSAHASATLTTSQVASVHTFQVTATNPAPGGGTSAPLAFSVSAPAPVATSVSPSFAEVGASDTAIVVAGSNFVPTSTVFLGGTPLATTFVSASVLDAVIPAASLASAASLALSVSTPAPGGGTSGTLGFTVDNPGPTITAISPSSATIPATDTAITVSGTGFVSGVSVVQIGSAAVTTTYAGETLGATIPAAQLASATTLSVTVVNPAPGGGTSNVVFFSANDPVPAITSVSPASIYAGSAATSITLAGTGFVASSVVQVNGATVAIAAQSATSLTATVPASVLALPTTLSVTVTNPAPGGGTSAPATISVGCNTSGASVILSALSTPTTLALSFTGAPTAERITQSEVNDSCPSTAEAGTSSPYLTYVVVNDTAASATLSAWAVCNKTDDGFLTFYTGSAVPTTQAELENCTGYVAEGKDGDGDLNSPQPGTSDFCPGLTKANGDGLTLAACAMAVVLIQPYTTTDTSYTPPTTLTIELQ